MLNKRSVLLGYLAILPFLSGFAIPPLINFMPADPRSVPVNIGFAFVTCFFLWVLSTGEIKRLPTVIPAAFIGYNILCMHLAPTVSVIFNGIGYPGIWLYKAFLFSLVYFLFFVAVYSEGLEVNKLFKVLQWAGFIMAVYMLLQWLHLDQFTQLAINPEVDRTNSPLMGGAMWTPTLAAAFLAICVPAYLGKGAKHWMLIPVLIAIFLTKSLFAMTASGLALAFYFCHYFGARKLFAVIVICGVSAAFLCHGKLTDRAHGRFGIWAQIVHEWKSAPISQEIKPDMDQQAKDFLNDQNNHIYPITGMGPGSYVPLFSIKENTPWKQGHNEFLEYFLYERGLVGVAFYVLAMIWIFSINPVSVELITLMSIFTAMLTLSMGTFIWHLEPFRSLTCVVLALICAMRKGNYVRKDHQSTSASFGPGSGHLVRNTRETSPCDSGAIGGIYNPALDR